MDARQEWVQVLRDSNIVKAVHVDTTLNLSDMFTKALDLATFDTKLSCTRTKFF